MIGGKASMWNLVIDDGPDILAWSKKVVLYGSTPLFIILGVTGSPCGS